MARLVKFHGRPHHLPNDSMKADPIPGVWFVGDRPQQIPESTECFTEKVFDRALAEHCGRTCGDACEGDCFALLYVAVANLTAERRHEPDYFTSEPWPPEPAPEPTKATAPMPAPTTKTKTTRRAAQPPRSNE